MKKIKCDVVSKFENVLSDDNSAKALSDFFKEKLSQENTRISYAMQKLTSYRSFLLFLIVVVAPFFSYFVGVFGLYFSLFYYFLYYLYCYYMYIVISSAIGIKSSVRSTSDDYEFAIGSCNRGLVELFLFDAISTRKDADYKVSLLSGAERYLKVTFAMFIGLFASFTLSNIDFERKPKSDERGSFQVYREGGQIDLQELSNFTEALSVHRGTVYVLYCEHSPSEEKKRILFSVLGKDDISVVFTKAKTTSLCKGEVLVHF
ncbi:hypothetical protein EAG18_11380 [Pseudoalteromonas sp. J010]|nr:hypothetical protein EAG18_11380 [Pseudoalteromonas sp. J010]